MPDPSPARPTAAPPDRPTRRPGWLHAALLLIGSGIGGGLAPVLARQGIDLPLIWLPAGIALGGLLRGGLSLWPAALLGTLLVALLTGVPLAPTLALAAGSTAAALLGASWLRRLGLQAPLDQRRDLSLFVVIGVVAAPLLGSGLAAFWHAGSGRVGWVDLPGLWMRLWSADALGVLAAGLPLLTFSRDALRQAFSASRGWQAALLIVATLGAGLVAAAHGAVDGATVSTLYFLPHLLLACLAWRCGLFVTSSTALLVSVGSLLALLLGGAAFPADGTLAGLPVLFGPVASLFALPVVIGVLRGERPAGAPDAQLALDVAQIGVADWDTVQGRVVLSPRWLALLGSPTQRVGDSLAGFWALIHPDELADVQQAFATLAAHGTADRRVECRMRRASGEWRRFELHARAVERAPDGSLRRVLITGRDIEALQLARDRQDLTQSVFQQLNEGLLITDARHRVIDVNPMFLEMTGYTREELVGQLPPMLQERIEDDAHTAQRQILQASLEATGSWRGEFRQRRRDGEIGLLQLAISSVRSASGTALNHVMAITDITGARAQLEQLERQAHFDELTRLPNRARLAQMLQSAMQTSRREGSLLTVCYLDIDHFKPINDRLGHGAGDRLLVELANRMRRSLRSWAGGDDVVARIGGDEFVLLLRTVTIEESRYAVERVLTQLCQPYHLGPEIGADEPVRITVSIGATVFPLDSADAETLLRHADHAMYDAKQSGRNGYLFFDAEHNRRAEERFVAVGRVQEGLDAEEFRLYFQPKVDLRTSQVLGFEALLRWKHPKAGLVSPAQFLPLIENTDLNLSIAVGNWVMQRGIDQLAQWLRLGLDLTVSINVSARHLQEPLFAEHLSKLLARHDGPVAKHLIIEVLETVALADIDYTCTLMEACRAMGVRFALDDFGTGYSTFTYLKRLPVDMLKIDRSFVCNMLADHEDLAIVEGVIGLSQTFGCAVVAEGVETPAQARRLIEIGCSIGQGNGIAAAMPADEVVDWVHHYKGMPSAEAVLPV